MNCIMLTEMTKTQPLMSLRHPEEKEEEEEAEEAALEVVGVHT